MADLAAAIKRAEEALAHMEDCLATGLPPAEWDVRAYASAIRDLLAATEPAPEPVSNAYTLPEEVREAAKAFRRVNSAQRGDSCTDAGCIVCKRREAGDRLLAALAAFLWRHRNCRSAEMEVLP